jgi:predicted GNAT family N-acyltransferase
MARRNGGRPSIEPLAKHHDRLGFSSGIDALDIYFRDRVGQDLRNKVAAPFVLVDRQSGAIAGYYTLSALSIKLSELPEAVRRKLPKYPIVPATLIGRLAVDRRSRGQGCGELLLMDALHRSLRQSEHIGSFAVVVDAKDDQAKAFYERYDFLPFPDDAMRLFLPMPTIARLFPQ